MHCSPRCVFNLLPRTAKRLAQLRIVNFYMKFLGKAYYYYLLPFHNQHPNVKLLFCTHHGH